MNILFIHEIDWLKKVVFDIHSLAETLAASGHNVYAIDYEDTWQKKSFWDFGTFKTREITSKERAVPEAAVTIRRPGFIKIPGISRVTAAVTHYFAIKKIIREKKIDVILLYSVPTNGLQALAAAGKAGVPVIFRSIDMLHGLVSNPVLGWATRCLEKRVYPRAGLILTITPNHTRYVVKMGADAAKVKLLPLPVDTGLFRPGLDSAEIRQKWSLSPQDKVVLFIGTLFSFSGLDGFLREFPRIVRQVPDARLLIVGDGSQRKELEGIIQKLGLREQVIVTGFQPFTSMPQYINLAAVCINPFLNGPATRDIFPGKIIQYVACGKAVVATPLLGITSLISDESKGVLYAETPAAMADKVIRLLKYPQELKKVEQAGLDYVRQVHGQQKIGRELIAILEEITRRPRQG